MSNIYGSAFNPLIVDSIASDKTTYSSEKIVDSTIQRVDWKHATPIYVPATVDTPAKLQQYFDDALNNKIFNYSGSAQYFRWRLDDVPFDMSDMTLYLRDFSIVGGNRPIINIQGGATSFKKIVMQNIGRAFFDVFDSDGNTDLQIDNCNFGWDCHDAFKDIVINNSSYLFRSNRAVTRNSFNWASGTGTFWQGKVSYTGDFSTCQDCVGAFVDATIQGSLNIRPGSAISLTTTLDSDYGSYNAINVGEMSILTLYNKVTIGAITLGAGSTLIYDSTFNGTVDNVINNGGVIIDNRVSHSADTLQRKDWVFDTSEDFEAAKDSIPVGARVVKLYEFPDNGYTLDRPDLWPVGTEIDFGGGLYGFRKVGTITDATAVSHAVGIVSIKTTTIKLKGCGGSAVISNSDPNYIYQLAIPCSDIYVSQDNTYGVVLDIPKGVRTNAPYDVWVTYTK